MDQPPPTDWRTDEQLVAAINRGDDSAFDALYFKYRDWIVRLAHRFTANHEDALDVLQDTFAYLLNQVPHLTLTARMTTFLYPIVRSLSVTILRRRQKESRAARQSETSLTAAPRPVPRDVDDDILFAARRRLTETRRTRRWGRIAVIAAAIALIFGLEHLMQPPRPLPNIQPFAEAQTRITHRQDIDHNGRVDILDAFALARMIRSGEKTSARWDINGDGRVDQADVDAIAMSAVQINGGAS